MGDGKWMSYEKIEPLRAILGIVTTLKEGWNSMEQYDRDGQPNNMYVEAGTVAIGAFARVSTEAYMVDAIGGALAMLKGVSSGNPDYAMKEVGRVFESMSTPNFIRQYNRSFDDNTIRDAETWLEKWKRGIPGLSSELPPRLTIWGDEQIYPESLGPDFISPLKTLTREYDSVDKELIRLGVNVPEAVKSISYEGMQIDLTAKQRYDISLARGKGPDGDTPLKDVFKEMFDDPMFQAASDMDKKEEITKIFTQANETAKQYLIGTDWDLQTTIDEAVEAREIHRLRTQQ